MDHVEHIANHWTDKIKDMPTITKSLRYIFTVYNFSVGIFLRSNPHHPVSWVVYWDYGHSAFVFTLPEHCHKGLSRNILVHQYVKMLKMVSFQLRSVTQDLLLLKVRFRHVEKIFPGCTWRDSITGECFWQLKTSYMQEINEY